MEKRLGKGLGALITEDTGKAKQKIENIKLKDIVPNPMQPRKNFGEQKMSELIDSIKEKGVIQPILARKTENGLEIIAGERRWRAAQTLGIEEVPAIVKEGIDDAATLELSLIENIQREELNPVEEAVAYRELGEKYDYTLEKIGQMVGKDKTTISNSLRLLSLSKEILELLEKGAISTGHAKVLLSVTSEHKRRKLAKSIVKNGLSVRETERIAHLVTDIKRKRTEKKDPDVARVEEELQHRLGTKVRIHQGKKRGRIEIQYYSNDDMKRLLGLLMGAA
ncbi:MAG: ParB/RepB/Spo0J family partition protein [Candidatus Omnitrophica bacterium]|nr:ParB/RepB/Spo0J family partition protein [Candidatus Omnitrophota bacterium]